MSEENVIHTMEDEIKEFYKTSYNENTLEYGYFEFLLGQKSMLEDANGWQGNEITRLRGLLERIEFEALQYSHGDRLLKKIELIAKEGLDQFGEEV